MNRPGKATIRFMSIALPAFLLASFAADAAPAWQNELTSPLPGAFPKLPPSTLEFQVSWNGTIRAGTVRIEFAPPGVRKPDTLIVRSSAASQGAAATLFPYQTHFWSELSPATLRPHFFHAQETDHLEKVDTTITHFPTRVESRQVTKTLKSGKSKQTDRTFTFAPVFDIFSAMLHIRSQKLEAGDQIVLVIHPFDTPYLLRVKVHGREVLNGRKAIRLTVGMRKNNRKTLELRPYVKLKQDATLWLSDDADRIPIELRAAAFIGEIRATLTAHRKP
jgi:hypothetical protein